MVQSTHTYSKKKFIITGAILAGIAILALGAVFILTRVYAIGAQPPVFVFAQEKVPGWWAGTNYNMQASYDQDGHPPEEPKEKMPVASITVMHGEGEGKPAPDNCFLLYAYYPYVLDDAAAAYKKYEDAKVVGDTTVTLKTINVSTQTFATPEGNVAYELRQYSRSSTDAGDISLSGYEVGFAPLANGYIQVEGICSLGSQLAGTIPVLSAVQLASH